MIVLYALLYGLLTLIASASPLLTFANLWQLKEWRIDRLREHIRENGWFRQIFGTIRPGITLFFFVISPISEKIFQTSPLLLIALLILAGVSIAQIGLKKQPMPVGTQKAVVLVLATMCLTAFTALTLVFVADSLPAWKKTSEMMILFLPVLQPIIFALTWLLLWPIDRFLKMRTLARGRAARARLQHLTVIGITGSVGKTTTKELLAHILKVRGAIATPAHVNTEMGVARWLSTVLKDLPEDSTKTVIVEMGAYRKGEIALLCSIAQPTMGIITYVGTQHISLFGSREAIIEGKGELFASLPRNGHAFANRDNDAYAALVKRCQCKVTSVGTGNDADIHAFDLEETSTGIRFKALDTTFDVPLFGTHTITSVLLAIAAAQKVGVPVKEIVQAVKTFTPMAHTFNVKTVGSVTVLDDTYNSSPASVEAAIEWARRQPQKQKVLVFDGIIELGKEEESSHVQLARLASEVFQKAYIVHPRFLGYFRHGGFGERAMLVSASKEPVSAGSLLACIGRMPQSIINRFLP
jgi:UDP-N-acetylmuramyl pentapeptide synthase